MELRIAGLVLPLVLLVPGAAAAQSGTTTCSIDVDLFDTNGDACVVGLVPDDTTRLEALKAAQVRWDALAAQLGPSVALLWLGPRPKTVGDIWWLPLTPQ